MQTFFDQTINGLAVGNIYALTAVGLAIVFSVGNLINFAHGSVYLIGAYTGWFCVTRLGLPLWATFLVVMAVCGLTGLVIERLGLRGIQAHGRIAPLLATIGISFILDQAVQLIFTPNPQAFPNPLQANRIALGRGSLGATDLLIAACGLLAVAILYVFLRYSRLGWALRATAQDREAAQQMGVDVNQVNQIAFVLASVLGGIAGLLVGMYYGAISPGMGVSAGLKGFAATLLGGLGSIPGALWGGLALGLIESYGVAIFGASYRNLFAFIIILLILVARPNGLFGRARALLTEPMTGSFLTHRRAVQFRPWQLALLVLISILLPFVLPNPYLLQVLAGGWALALVALSFTLIAGSAGQISLGQAGFMTIGAYSSALLTLHLGLPVELAILCAAFLAAVIGSVLVLPALRLRTHYVAIATLGIGEIINQIVLNWDKLTNGPLGIANIPPLHILGQDVVSARGVYWYALALLLGTGWVYRRLMRSRLGRVWRAIREDEIAAQTCGVSLAHYKALAFAVSAWMAGLSGAFLAHLYTYINHETFGGSTSILVLTMAMLGGLGNGMGAISGALLLTILPEVLRPIADFRFLLYGIVLLLTIRYRPQGLLGTQ